MFCLSLLTPYFIRLFVRPSVSLSPSSVAPLPPRNFGYAMSELPPLPPSRPHEWERQTPCCCIAREQLLLTDCEVEFSLYFS